MLLDIVVFQKEYRQDRINDIKDILAKLEMLIIFEPCIKLHI